MHDRFKIIVTAASSKTLIEMFLASYERAAVKNPPTVIEA